MATRNLRRRGCWNRASAGLATVVALVLVGVATTRLHCDEDAAAERVPPFAEGPVREVLLRFSADSWATLQEHPFVYTRAALQLGGGRLEDVGVRYKGNSTFSERSEHKSFKVDTDRFVKGQSWGDVRTLNFHHPFKDPSRVREAVAYQVFRASGLVAPRANHVALSVRIGDDPVRHLGVFTATEDVNRRFLARRARAAEGKSDELGDLYKIEGFGDPFAEPRGRRSGGEPHPGFEPEVGEKRSLALARLLAGLRAGRSGSEELAFLRDQLDVDAVLRFVALNAILVNWDSYNGTGHNAYLFRDPKSGRFSFLPWDTNEAFGRFTFGMWTEELVRASVFRPTVGRKLLVERLLAHESLRKRYVEIVRELLAGPCTKARVLASVREAHERIAAAVEREPRPEHPVSAFRASVAEDGGGLVELITRRWAVLAEEIAESDETSGPARRFIARGPAPEPERGRRPRGFGGPPDGGPRLFPPGAGAGVGGPGGLGGRDRRRVRPWWARDAILACDEGVFALHDGRLLRLEPKSRETLAELDLRPPPPAGVEPPPSRPPELPPDLQNARSARMAVHDGKLWLVSGGVLVVVPLEDGGKFGEPVVQPLRDRTDGPDAGSRKPQAARDQRSRGSSVR